MGDMTHSIAHFRTPIRRCLIANRGEIAVRIIRACREIGVESVAVYSDADSNAFHVRQADRAVHIGAANPSESYLNINRLIDAARQTDCDAIHPGYGFLSESAAFAGAVRDAGLIWVGPPPDAIDAMGDKIGARNRMGAAGVPIAPSYEIDAPSLHMERESGGEVAFPVMVKAAGGGGGRGIRIVRDPAGLTEAVESARREAQNAFGDPRVFVEKYIERGRHIEVQVFADAHGNVVHLGERECSAQRRHQKVIEESPSPLVDEAQRARIGAAAVEAARAVGYINAGTVEFIADNAGNFYFLEMNTRLQVEHPVTEWVTGLDLVKLQFAVASGESLPFGQNDIQLRGHAIEARLYAENPLERFMPSAGRVLAFQPPIAPGVRVDAGIERSDTISIHYDPLIAKIIAYDPTRDGAIRKLDQALRSTVILGVDNNRDFLRSLLTHPAFVAGEVDTTFIEAHLDELIARDTDAETLQQALIAAAIHDSNIHKRAIETKPQQTPWTRTDGFRMG